MKSEDFMDMFSKITGMNKVKEENPFEKIAREVREALDKFDKNEEEKNGR